MRYTKSLKKEYLFKRVLNKGKFAVNQNIAVHVLHNLNQNSCNNILGICVSKKHGNSVIRNKLKRWARESYKEIEQSINLGLIIVIVYKKDIKERIKEKTLNFHVVKKEMISLLEKLGEMNEKNNNDD